MGPIYWAYDDIEDLQQEAKRNSLCQIQAPERGAIPYVNSPYAYIKKKAFTSSVIWTLLK